MKLIGQVAIGALALGLLAGTAAAQTTVRITWYSDGNEGEVLRDLLDRFEEANPDIDVIVDNVAYQSIVEGLPVQLAAGEGPDMARVTDLGGLAQYYLDLRPHLDDPAYGVELDEHGVVAAGAGRRDLDQRLHDPAFGHRPLRQPHPV